jgi:hypothetical protein
VRVETLLTQIGVDGRVTLDHLLPGALPAARRRAFATRSDQPAEGEQP